LKIDTEYSLGTPSDIPELARRAEEFGFGAFWVNETKHDPFVQLTLAASTTKSIRIGSSIALAFTRSPVSIAYASWDIQELSGGRLILGLGSQVKGHIERRFGMRWESPRTKMKEVVGLMRSAWESWQTGSKLDFQGKFFRVDLMTPFFDPGPIGDPKIPIFIAGVNRGMCNLAGRVADGLHVHPLHTDRYLREVIVPATESGLQSAKRDRKGFEVAVSVFSAVGDNGKEVKAVKEALRSQIAFYASTRTYAPVMKLHGWEAVSERLHKLSVEGDWEKMPGEVDDSMLDEFVIEGEWSEIGRILRERYAGVADRVRLYLPFDGQESWREVVRSFAA